PRRRSCAVSASPRWPWCTPCSGRGSIRGPPAASPVALRMLQPAAPGEREVMTQTSIATAPDRVIAHRPGLPWANDALLSNGLRTTLRVVAELALLSLLYAGYVAGRAAIGVHTGSAHDRGRWILDAESLTHLDVELPLNRLVSAVPPLGL